MNVTLVEFDVGAAWDRYQITLQNTEVLWINYAPGVWATSFAGDFSVFNTDLVGAEFTWYGAPALNPAGSAEAEASITRIGSVFANNMRLPNAGGLAALLSLGEGGFFFDETTAILYVRFPLNAPPGIYSIVAGIATLSSNKGWTDEENGRIYTPEVVGITQVAKTIDPLFFGRIKFNDASITLQNLHGQYDLLADFDTYGQEVRILYGDSDDIYSRFRRMWTGYVDDYTLSEGEAVIRASDRRKLLEKPVPVRFFDSVTFADLSDRDEGKPIPVAYGKIIGAGPTAVNRGIYDRATAQVYTFKLCDTADHDGIASIQQVRYKGEALTPTSPITDSPTTAAQFGGVNLTNATFETFKPAGDTYDFRDVEVDFTGVENGGTPIQAGLDVIVDMIAIYGSIPFSPARYNVAEWAAAASANVGLYVDRDSTIAKQVERVAASLRVQFDVQGDGRFTVRRFAPATEPSYTVRPDELLSEIAAQYSSEEFASRLYVEYQGGVLRYTADEAEIVDRYKTTRPATFETVLTTAADAQEFAEDIMSLAKDFPPLFPVTVPIPTRDFRIEENVYAILNRVGQRWFGRVKCRVEGITFDFDREQAILNLRGFERVADEGVIIYSQGFGAGFIGFAATPFSETQYPEVS